LVKLAIFRKLLGFDTTLGGAGVLHASVRPGRSGDGREEPVEEGILVGECSENGDFLRRPHGHLVDAVGMLDTPVGAGADGGCDESAHGSIFCVIASCIARVLCCSTSLDAFGSVHEVVVRVLLTDILRLVVDTNLVSLLVEVFVIALVSGQPVHIWISLRPALLHPA